MGKKLVIVESPAKEKTIGRILGDDYIVASSIGHVRDLPLKNLGVDIKNGFKPKYVLLKGKKKVVDDLKKKASQSDSIYLAPDPDREGEAIAWHLKVVLEVKDEPKEFFRVQYNEITPNAVRKAFDNPCELDMKRVDAQQARRVLDRIVGYTVSPMLWRRIGRGLSAGRVQSVALRLVCEREEEISKFIPEEYWLLGAVVRKLIDPLDSFQIRLMRIDGNKAAVATGEQAESIKNDLLRCSLGVTKIETRSVTKKAPPPYITSTLQQAASTYCSFSPKRTMGIAQKLYEGIDIGGEHVGLITYMRTDSFSISEDALRSCRALIKDRFGPEYCPEKPNYYKNKAGSQGAHEAIRPTDINRAPESLKGCLAPAEVKLYGLIWRRFVASQMSPARINQRKAVIENIPAPGETARYLFHATASDVEFPGYMKVTGIDIGKKDDESESGRLPPLSEGEKLECLEWLSERKETQPPARYGEASLVRALENNGIGRPSTYAQIITTLYQRNYVAAEKRTLKPTDLGMKVSALLVETLGDLFDAKFTASMEESLDKIEEGTVGYKAMLEEFYKVFEVWMEATKLPPADDNMVKTVLSALESVKEWAPETKRGKRTYSDKKFVESVQKQCEKKEKPVSQKQLLALVRITLRYRDQSPQIEQILTESCFESILNDPAIQPPRESTLRKLEILENIAMDESGRNFVDSLKARAEDGRQLSEAQIYALDNIVMVHSGKVEGFDALKEDLEISDAVINQDDKSKSMLEALASVHDWAEPVKRGKRVFDDRAFCESLADHFARKGFLSPKQAVALKKLVKKYQTQIPDYEHLAEEFEIKVK